MLSELKGFWNFWINVIVYLNQVIGQPMYYFQYFTGQRLVVLVQLPLNPQAQGADMDLMNIHMMTATMSTRTIGRMMHTKMMAFTMMTRGQ